MLAVGVTTQAGTFTIVDLPATGTDAATGISTSKTYTHAFDFGVNVPVTINGVVFERGPTANLTAAYTATSRQGYGYTISDTRATTSISATHAGNDPSAQADGSCVGLLWDMVYHVTPNVGDGLQLTLSNLVPLTTYSTRFYYRTWTLPSDASRVFNLSADGEAHGAFSDTMRFWEDAGGAHYLDYTFTADDKDVTFRFVSTVYNYGMHIYGFTNEVLLGPGCASRPSPADGQTDVLRDTVLSWTPGPFAATHDVYLGASQADVAAAGRADPRGVLVSRGQDANTYDPGRLELGKTYYWRIDEVNAAPDNTIYTGKIWSFAVEPRSYTVTNVKVTASSSYDKNSQPEKTIDGSGLNPAGQHSTVAADMWLSSVTGPQPTWIQYEFDQAQKLDQMAVWNSNQAYESLFGVGAKDVTIEYSTDANNWTPLGDYVIGRAPGTPAYAGDKPVDFGGVVAKYVKLTIHSNWGGKVKQYSLSEVRFFSVPVRARLPQPANNASNVAAMATLSWRYGREAATHEVYLGTDPNALALVATVTEPTCQVAVDMSKTYYWQVAEVNAAEDPAAWKGDIWKFAVEPYITLDDFESYTNNSPKRVFQTWIDGAGFSPDEFFPKGNDGNGTGALVGYDPLSGNIMETMMVHGGSLSAPFYYGYENRATSEATRTFNEPQDWTKHAIQSLVLYLTGMADNKDARLYVQINNGTKLFHQGAADDLRQPVWAAFGVDLAKAGVNLESVSKLTIGVEGAGASGSLLLDDIRLYPKAVELVAPVAPSTTGLVAHYKLDGDGKDAAGSHHGTLTNSPTFVDGKVGQAMVVTLDQYVNVPYAADLSLNTFTVAVWVNISDITGWRGFIGTRFNGEYTFDVKANAAMIHGDIGNGAAWLSTTVDVPAVLSTGVWYHICYVFDDPADTAEIYVNGVLARTMVITGTPLFMSTGEDLRIGTDYSTEPMRGMIDDVYIYNRALSAAEVAGLAGRTTPAYTPF
jgi:hypothetical protein